MSEIPTELFTDLKTDEIQVDDSVVANAKNGNGTALFTIGLHYYRLQHSKASNWFYLSTTRGSQNGYFFLGLMYHFGTGVNVDYLYAIEAYLNAAKHDTKPAFTKIGDLFNEGLGVSLNKYKALEWYAQNRDEFSQTKMFMELKDQDKSKPIQQLIQETEDIIKAEKTKLHNINNITNINNNNSNNNSSSKKNNSNSDNHVIEQEKPSSTTTVGEQLKFKVEEINRLRSDIDKHKQQFSHLELEKELQLKKNIILDDIVHGLREDVKKSQGETEMLRQRLNKQTETESDQLDTTRKTDSILKLNQSLEKEAKYTKEENSTFKRSIRNLERQLKDKKDIINNLRKQILDQTPDERYKSLQDENTLLRESNGDLEEHLISKLQDIARMEDENQLLKKANSELERRLITNEDDSQNTSNENQMLKQKLNNAEEQLMGKERETASIKDENRLLKESIQYLEQRVNHKIEENKRLGNENHSLVKSTRDLENQLRAVTDAMKEGSKATSERKTRRLNDENVELKQTISRLERQLAEEKKIHRACKDENRLLKKSNENLDREVYDNENKIKSMEQRIKQKDDHIATLKKENSHNNGNDNHQKLKDENIELKQQIREHEITIHALKGENKALSTSSNPQMTNRMIETMDSLLQARTNEMELLKQNMSFLLEKEKEKTSRLEKEILTLMKEGATSTHKTDDSQNILAVKAEESSECIVLSSCQISSKKRKMASTID